VILNYLRSGQFEKRANIDMKFLRNEAEYFGIQGLINVLDDEIAKNESQINLKHATLETLNNNLANCIKIVKKAMWKEGAEEYFRKILQHSYTAEERKYCMEQVDSWSRDFDPAVVSNMDFMDLFDSLIEDDIYSHCRNNARLKKLLRIGLNLVYLRKLKSSPDYEAFTHDYLFHIQGSG